MATIRDVASEAGVSTATVSRALNGAARVSEKTRRRVLAAADRLDYWPNIAARALTTKLTHAVGVLLPDLYGEFFSEVIHGIDLAARAEGLKTLLSSSHADTDTVLAAARSMRGRIDGLIVMAPDHGSADAIRRIARGFDMVLLSPRFDVDGCGSIAVANFDGAYAVVEHLIRLGHRRIAILRGPIGNVDAEERLLGWRRAMEDAGIESTRRLEFAGDFSEFSGYRVASAILSVKPQPTAVFAANDCMAIGFLGALPALGVKVPDDLAVAGFDDIRIARYMNPPLTSVHVDAQQMGVRAVQMLVSRGKTAQAGREVLPARLVVRESCGARKAPKGGPSS